MGTDKTSSAGYQSAHAVLRVTAGLSFMYFINAGALTLPTIYAGVAGKQITGTSMVEQSLLLPIQNRIFFPEMNKVPRETKRHRFVETAGQPTTKRVAQILKSRALRVNQVGVHITNFSRDLNCMNFYPPAFKNLAYPRGVRRRTTVNAEVRIEFR